LLLLWWWTSLRLLAGLAVALHEAVAAGLAAIAPLLAHLAAAHPLKQALA
jgi:hypothetical protein